MMNDVPKRRRRKESRAAEIVESARAIFCDHGFAAARIDDIAARAGVSKGLVYVYFPTKEALFEAVARASVLPVLEVAAAAVTSDSVTPASDQMRAILTMLYRELVATDRRKLIYLILSEGARFPALTAFYYREVLSRGRDLLRAIIERGVARGDFGPTALTRYPEIVIAPVLLSLVWGMLFEAHEPLDIDTFREAHVDVIVRALAA